MDDPSAMMERMERQMESFRQKMDSMSVAPDYHNYGNFPGHHSSSSSHSSSSRVVTSKSASSGMDPNKMVTESNMIESSKESVTIDGQTTSSSSHSSSSKTSTGLNNLKNNDNSNNTPGSLISSPTANLNEGVMDFLKDAYELGEDGKVRAFIYDIHLFI